MVALLSPAIFVHFELHAFIVVGTWTRKTPAVAVAVKKVARPRAAAFAKKYFRNGQGKSGLCQRAVAAPAVPR